MFQLLQPIWLFALAGLSIPVIIHLWNRKPGKTLKVGSVALVKENILSYKRRIKLSEILLLLLRCLLLACITIALTGPVWRRPAGNESKGWVLLSKQQLAQTYNRFKPEVDSLMKAGLEFHYFEEGFKKDNLENALKSRTDSNNYIKQPSYRGLTELLNEQTNSRLPLYIFTDNYLRNFGGNRNAVSLNLHWDTYTPDTVRIKPAEDTASLQVTVFTHNYDNDAHYLEAALEAIQQFSKRNIMVKIATKVADIPTRQDWLFWLSDEPPTDIKNAKNVLLYVKGEAVKQASYILSTGEQSFAPVLLYKLVIERDTAMQFPDAHWKDGFGHPVLSVKQQNNAAYYHFYTHFDPSWSELPWSDNFPAILYKLLFTKNKIAAGIADKTIIDSSQLMPVLLNDKEAAVRPVVFITTKLTGVFWLIAFILFFAERSLSFYQRKENANG